MENEEASNLCRAYELFKDRWEVVKKLGAGGFGQIYVATDRRTTKLVALKVEQATNPDKAQLPIELQVMKRFQGTTNAGSMQQAAQRADQTQTTYLSVLLAVCSLCSLLHQVCTHNISRKPHAVELLGAGVKGELNFIAMALVGPNLATLRKLCPLDTKRFSAGTSARLAKDCLEAISDLHGINVLHRDIKPANFAMGPPDSPQKNTVYILDFGLARFHFDTEGNIRPPRNRAGFRGTMRYASMASHLRQDLGRKDDLISLFFMIYEFWKANLHWRELKNHGDVMEAKKNCPLEKMMADIHPTLVAFANHVNALHYSDKPDYQLITNLFVNITKESGAISADPMDWENKFQKVIEEESKKTTTFPFNKLCIITCTRFSVFLYSIKLVPFIKIENQKTIIPFLNINNDMIANLHTLFVIEKLKSFNYLLHSIPVMLILFLLDHLVLRKRMSYAALFYLCAWYRTRPRVRCSRSRVAHNLFYTSLI